MCTDMCHATKAQCTPMETCDSQAKTNKTRKKSGKRKATNMDLTTLMCTDMGH